MWQKGKNKKSQSLGAIAEVVSEWQLILWWCGIKIPPPIGNRVNESGNLMSWQSGKSKYNLDNKDFMSWIGLIESFPQKWKRERKLLVLYSDEGYNPCSLRREPFLPNLTVKETYKTLIRPLVKQPTAQKSIESVLQRNDIDWATVYLLPQKTSESRMRIFQYKILSIICILIIGFTNLVM